MSAVVLEVVVDEAVAVEHQSHYYLKQYFAVLASSNPLSPFDEHNKSLN